MSTVASPDAQSQPYPDPIPGILPFGTVSIFSAASGAGKTTMIAEWCARLQSGRTIFGHATHRPTAIGYIAADRAWDQDHQLWFNAAGCHDVRHYSLADDPKVPEEYWNAGFAHRLFDYCQTKLALPAGALLVIDPMTPLFIGGNPNDQRPVARALMQLGRACRKHQVTILATAYFGKQKSNPQERYTRAIDRIAGSGVFAGYSHTQMYLVESDDQIDQPYQIFGWKPRHAKEATFEVVRDEQTGLFVRYKGLVPEAPIPEQDRPTRILQLIPPEGMKTTDLEALALTQFMVSAATTQRDVAKLLLQKRLHRPRNGFVIPVKPS